MDDACPDFFPVTWLLKIDAQMVGGHPPITTATACTKKEAETPFLFDHLMHLPRVQGSQNDRLRVVVRLMVEHVYIAVRRAELMWMRARRKRLWEELDAQMVGGHPPITTATACTKKEAETPFLFDHLMHLPRVHGSQNDRLRVVVRLMVEHVHIACVARRHDGRADYRAEPMWSLRHPARRRRRWSDEFGGLRRRAFKTHAIEKNTRTTDQPIRE